MDSGKTIVIKKPLFDDSGPMHRHAALIALKGEEIGRDFRLRRRPMVIGRSPDAAICLPETSSC